MTSDIDNCVLDTIGAIKDKGRVMESGIFNVQGELWSYKFKKLKQKPKTPTTSQVKGN